MRTGLFFGTFNPVHRGHEALVQSFLSSGLIDDIWVILTPNPPHKNIAALAPFEDRWNMLQLAFKEKDELKITDVEQRIPSPHYTFKTLSFLKNSYPNQVFLLCIGGDTLQQLSSWYEYEKISHKAELLVAERPDSPNFTPPELNGFRVHFCEHNPVAISSTHIRKALMAGNMPGSGELHPEVLQYIQDKDLYRTDPTIAGL